ncbi:MAG: chromate transporter [Treponema sp.]|jgi:chromate transporter|nr:chromate transporter [Treponema sp.]
MKGLLELFSVFLKIGVLTFGGGYAMIPVVEKELINKKGWIDMEEVMDYYTIAQITPGIIGVNLSTFVGCKRNGIWGGFLATLGFVLPGVVFITAIALFLANFADFPVVKHAFTGIRVAVCALIVDTVIKLVKGVFKNRKAVIMYALVFVLSALWSVSPVLLVAAAGLLGILVFREKPATASHAASQSSASRQDADQGSGPGVKGDGK